MKIKEKQQVTEFKEITIAIKCDVCGKVHKGSNTPHEWHRFDHHHNEWGNDSCDSYEYYEVCSSKCYWIKFKECVKDLEGYNSAEIDGFEIKFARMLIQPKII